MFFSFFDIFITVCIASLAILCRPPAETIAGYCKKKMAPYDPIILCDLTLLISTHEFVCVCFSMCDFAFMAKMQLYSCQPIMM